MCVDVTGSSICDVLWLGSQAVRPKNGRKKKGLQDSNWQVRQAKQQDRIHQNFCVLWLTCHYFYFPAEMKALSVCARFFFPPYIFSCWLILNCWVKTVPCIWCNLWTPVRIFLRPLNIEYSRYSLLVNLGRLSAFFLELEMHNVINSSCSAMLICSLAFTMFALVLQNRF